MVVSYGDRRVWGLHFTHLGASEKSNSNLPVVRGGNGVKYFTYG